MLKSQNTLEVLTLFAAYGFRKVSMGDIARAAGLSRQSIYNQHGSKEAVLDWALTSVLGEMTDAAVGYLETTDDATDDALRWVFQTWMGDHVPMLNGTPHGAEILDAALNSTGAAERDYEGAFRRALAAFLVARGVVATEAEGEERAFVLHIAGKGLILKCETREDFAGGMARVIAVVTG